MPALISILPKVCNCWQVDTTQRSRAPETSALRLFGNDEQVVHLGFYSEPQFCRQLRNTVVVVLE